MKDSDFTDKRTGELVPTIQGQPAFVPSDLPAELEWTPELIACLSDANLSIGQLHGIGLNLPNLDLLITPFVRREAEMSSRIEGTQASFEQLYLFEVQPRSAESKAPDVKEVHNYVLALEYGMQKFSELPVCLRLIKQLHEILLKDVRGEKKTPGQFRKVQNWIGPIGAPVEQASYVPPPPEQMLKTLDAFERFVNAPLGNLPVLIWLAMIHYQFEAIHPFLDGNGRIGRLLITLLLYVKGVLDKPLLYLSAYFERNRMQYYERLLRVSTHGQWNEWIQYFLQGIIEQSKDAFVRASQLMNLQQKYHEIVHTAKGSAMQIRLVDILIERPVITAGYVKNSLGITYPAAQNNIDKLVKAGILKEITGAKRNKVFVAEKVLEIINKPFAT